MADDLRQSTQNFAQYGYNFQSWGCLRVGSYGVYKRLTQSLKRVFRQSRSQSFGWVDATKCPDV